jgi:hypothetical protein
MWRVAIESNRVETGSREEDERRSTNLVSGVVTSPVVAAELAQLLSFSAFGSTIGVVAPAAFGTATVAVPIALHSLQRFLRD